MYSDWNIISVTLGVLYSLQLQAMQMQDLHVSLKTSDGSFLSWHMPHLLKHSQHLQGYDAHASVIVPFNRATMDSLAFVLCEYDKNPTSDNLRDLIEQFWDDNWFPLSEDFIWFRLMDYFQITIFNDTLIKLILNKASMRADKWFNEESNNQAWNVLMWRVMIRSGRATDVERTETRYVLPAVQSVPVITRAALERHTHERNRVNAVVRAALETAEAAERNRVWDEQVKEIAMQTLIPTVLAALLGGGAAAIGDMTGVASPTALVTLLHNAIKNMAQNIR